jgi:flagellar protein FliS
MSRFSHQSYLNERVLSADPLELVQILYGAALEALQQARGHLRSGGIAARSKAITKVGAILGELALSLRPVASSELSSNLADLYVYMQRQLARANFEQAESPLIEVEQLMATLLDGWQNCRPDPAPAPMPLESRSENQHAGSSVLG